MERRRHARTPVNINALLIGEKTVPKGCRIINVSQQGMLLYCEADGRLSTFNDGDTVDIHLTVQHAGEQKKLTIPATVRHVGENSVDVEFPHPDPILMDLIESYRVSDKHQLEATFGQNLGNRVTPLLTPHPAEIPSPDSTSDTASRQSHRPLYLAMLSLLLGLCIVTGGYIYTASIDSRINTLEILSTNQTDELTQIRRRVFSDNPPDNRYDSLNTRISALTEAVGQLENRLLNQPARTVSMEAGSKVQLQPAYDDPPVMITDRDNHSRPRNIVYTDDQPAATGVGPVTGITAPEPPSSEPAVIPASEAAPPQGPFRPTQQAAQTAAVSDPEPSGMGHHAPVVPAEIAEIEVGGPWRINLLSSPDRSDVQRLADKAAGLDISTRIEEAEVKGRTWWRLQVTGYQSMEQATSAAEPLKQALGINEVWILKHR
jgi:hypothetical protein